MKSSFVNLIYHFKSTHAVKAVSAFFVCISIISNVQAQIDFSFQEGTFMIKGSVKDLQSKIGIPKANIVVKARKTGATADAEGNFTMYVFPNDTLRFTSVNYISKEILVSSISKDSIYSIHVELMKDFIKLKDVVIYPFGNKEEFVDAFMNAKDVNKLVLPGVPAPKYKTTVPRPKFSNPISLIYSKSKKKRAADPDFRP